jgi:hypothetical protein
MNKIPYNSKYQQYCGKISDGGYLDRLKYQQPGWGIISEKIIVLYEPGC